MATPAQIAANRRNALKSTGPKTGQGKRASSRNAVKHGVYAQISEAELKPTVEAIEAEFDVTSHDPSSDPRPRRKARSRRGAHREGTPTGEGAANPRR